MAAHSERAVILAPRGRDAPVAAAMLAEGGIEAVIARNVPDLAAILARGIGFAIVTDEAFRSADLRPIAQYIGAQEEWSDLPFILLTERGGGIERNPAAGRLLETLGNVTFLERPFHPTTLISLARAARRARRRQYDARTRLETIREGEDRLRLALAAGGLGAWTVHFKDRRLDASAEAKAQFGRGPDATFTYDDLLAAIHAEDRRLVEGSAAASVRAGRDYDVEYRCTWPDGSTHWMQTRGRGEHDAAGQPVRMVGVTQDITERKAIEAELRAFAAELEERVEQRTREREEALAQLHEAQKLEMLGHLTGGVAHDFNNLLTPMLGNLDMLRRRHPDERSQRLIGSALQAAERARTLVSRLLAFARRQALVAQPIDPRALVDGMIELIGRSIGPQIEIAVDIPPDLPAAMVDPNQLELALLNLAVNARDAMPDGGRLTIAVGTGPGAAGMPPGRYVRFAIADTGIGMDEATLRRAVEPFYSTKGIGKGTGLCLSMVHGLAAQSGGALHLRSRVGEGTTAELWLPAAEHAAPVAPPLPDEGGAETPPLDILLVDDEELVRQGTGDMLGELGHAVTHAASGVQALTILRDRRFDLLVTDYLMPGMTGTDLAAEARRLRPDLRMMLVTGFADLSEQTAPDLVRLAKPFRQRELAQAVHRVAAGVQARRAAGPVT